MDHQLELAAALEFGALQQVASRHLNPQGRLWSLRGELQVRLFDLELPQPLQARVDSGSAGERAERPVPSTPVDDHVPETELALHSDVLAPPGECDFDVARDQASLDPIEGGAVDDPQPWPDPGGGSHWAT